MQEIDGGLHEAADLEALRGLREELGDAAGPVFHPGEIFVLKGYKYAFDGVVDGNLSLKPVGPTRALQRKRERKKRKRNR